jgi:hypothetical protein
MLQTNETLLHCQPISLSETSMSVRYSLELAETVKASSSPDIMSTTKKQTNQEEILHKKVLQCSGQE